MTINDIQNLIDLLGESPEIAELAVTATDGSEITIKRRATPLSAKAQAANVVFAAAEEPAAREEAPSAPQLSTIASTMVGVFHTAKPPLVVGSPVIAGLRVGFIEAIKLMNEVVSTTTGTVVEVLIEEGQPVEYGQVLYQVAPIS